MVNVLFVCTGNICRSPTAEAIMRKMAQSLDGFVKVDSAGTHGYHIGARPDPRSCEAALRRGYDLSSLRSRKIDSSDFDKFDLILAMDHANVVSLKKIAKQDFWQKIFLLMNFSLKFSSDIVPDPYYGGKDGFEKVLDYCEDGCTGLLYYLKR